MPPSVRDPETRVEKHSDHPIHPIELLCTTRHTPFTPVEYRSSHLRLGYVLQNTNADLGEKI